jgi:hypothetical protein
MAILVQDFASLDRPNEKEGIPMRLSLPRTTPLLASTAAVVLVVIAMLAVVVTITWDQAVTAAVLAFALVMMAIAAYRGRILTVATE